MTQTPADKTAKRISQREWLERHDASDSAGTKPKQNARFAPWAPADRIAVRA